MDDMGKLVAVAAVGVGGYFLYNSFFGAALPADAEYIGQLTSSTPQSAALPAGGTQTLTGPGYVYYGPSEGQYYVSQTAPTAAQSAAQSSALAASTPSSTGSTVTTSPSAGTTTPVAVGPAPVVASAAGSSSAPTSLAAIWSAMQAAAALDSNFTNSGGVLSGTPYHWMFYLTYVSPSAPPGFTGVWPPNLAEVFPGVDLTQPMASTTFWAALQPYLAHEGLSGLLSGLSCGCDSGGGGLVTLLLAGAAFGALFLAFQNGGRA